MERKQQTRPVGKTYRNLFYTIYDVHFLLVIAHFSGWLFFSDSNERPSLIRILLIVKNRQFKKFFEALKRTSA